MNPTQQKDALSPYAAELRRRYPGPEAIYRGARRRRALLHGGVAAAAMLAVCVIVDPVYRVQEFGTERGRTDRWTLADGSGLSLDTASRVRVEWGLRSRRLTLVEGEALFDVAPSHLRRFEVRVGDTLIEDIGTVFSVRSEAGELRVQVLEGAVRIHSRDPARLEADQSRILSAGGDDVASAAKPNASTGTTAAPSQPILVTQGQRIDIPAPGQVRQKPLSPHALAWSEGRLVFDAVPLSQAVAELQRYRSAPIRIAGAGVGDLRVSAQVEVSNLETIIRSLPEILPVQVARHPDGSVDIAPLQ